MATNLDAKRRPVTKGVRQIGEYPYYGASGIVDYVSDFLYEGDYLLVSEDGANLLARTTPIAFSATGKIWVNNHAHVLQFETYETRRFVEFYLNSIDLAPYISAGAQPKLNQRNLNEIVIPFPSLAEQARIVAILDRFDALTNDLTQGLPAEIAARKQQYEYYRDQLLSFIDGRIHFETQDGLRNLVISVKGGKLTPAFMRELHGVLEREESSELGGLICLQEPTKGMISEAASAGQYYYQGVAYDRLQIRTVSELLEGRSFHTPSRVQTLNWVKQPRLPL